MSLIEELRRRNVIKVVTAYAVAGFIILQLCDIIFPALNIPDETIGDVLIALIVFLPVVVAFTWLFEITPEGFKRTREVDRQDSISHFTGKRINTIIISLLSVALAFFVWQYVSRDENPAEPSSIAAEEPAADQSLTDAAATPPSQIDTRPSIAVLPFVNMSSDIENEYFSDGLSEEILNLLAQSPELKVAARTSSFFFKGKNQDLRQIGETLAVDHILEGSVRKAGNKVRITAQLISTSDGFHLWSKTYDRQLDDIFAVQDEIAGEVTSAMEVTLLFDGVMIADRSTGSEAYDLYLRAKEALYDRGRANVLRSVTLFKQTLTLDPEYAPAYVDMAVAELLLNWNYGVRTIEEAEINALAALDKAANLGYLTSDYYAVLGLYHGNLAPFDETHLPKSEAAFAKAIELNRNNARAYMWWATVISTLGNSGASNLRALELNTQAIKIDPLNRVANGNRVGYMVRAGHDEQALADIERLIRIDPEYDFYKAVRTSLHMGNHDYVRATAALVHMPNDMAQYPYLLMSIFYAFNDPDAFFEAVDMIPMENPSFEMIELAENARNATLAELRAEAEIMLLKPDPNFYSVAIIFNLMLQGDYELVRQLIENGRVDMANPVPSTAGSNGYDPRWAYLTSIYKLGETERSRRYAEALLEATRESSITGIGGRGTIHAICYLVLGEEEKALDELERVQETGWLSYYTEIDQNPMWDDLKQHPRVTRVKSRIDQSLDAQRPEVYRILIENGLASSL